MKKIRTAVIGVGYLGKFHAQKYKKLESSELVGVCDTNEENGQKIANELGVKYYKDAKDLVGLVDAVTIASTTKTHFPIAKLMLENGIHTLIEKPITVTSKQGIELCEIALKNNLKIQVGHIERFNSALVSAREKLQKPMFVEVHRLAPYKPRSLDVDVVLDLMIHDIDLLLSIVNSRIKSVSAVGVAVVSSFPDIANARIEFESGCIANITASRISLNTTRKFRVFQKDQYLSIDFDKGQVALTTKTGDMKDEVLPLEYDSWQMDKSDGLFEETKSFLDSIIHNKPVLVSGEDGVSALKVAEKILEDISRKQI